MCDARLLELSAKLFYRTIATRVIEAGLTELPENERLTPVQLSCLRYANLHPQPSVGEIADGLKISDAAAAKLIDRLVKRFILIREEHSEDRRVLKIILTEKGAALLECVTRRQQQYFRDIINRMPEEDLKAFQQSLHSFLKAAFVSPEAIDGACLKCGWDHILDCPGNLAVRELTGKDRDNR